MVNFYFRHLKNKNLPRLMWLFHCNQSDPRLFVTQLVGCLADRSGIATLPRWGHAENTFGPTIKSNTRGTAWTLLFSNAGHLKSSYSAYFLILIVPPQWVSSKAAFGKNHSRNQKAPYSKMYYIRTFLKERKLKQGDECLLWHQEKSIP